MHLILYNRPCELIVNYNGGRRGRDGC